MNKFPKHYSLIEEHPKHFMVHDSRDNKAFQVSKMGLHPATQMHMLRLPKFSDGGKAEGGAFDRMSDNKASGETDDIAKFAGLDSESINARDKENTDRREAQINEDKAAFGMSPVNSSQSTGATGDFEMPESPNVTPPVNPQVVPQQQTAQVQRAPQQQAQPQNQNIDFNAIPQGAPTLGTLNRATNQEIAGINQQAQGQMAQNKALAEAQKAHLEMEAQRNEVYQKTMATYQAQNEALTKDVMERKINPDQYWENHSRVGAALAVLVSGIGAGLQHSTQNLALGVIQNGIDKSIDSQKAELGKKENLLSNNLRIQGNLMQAENATRLQTSAMLQGKLMQLANETGDPIIQGAAQQKAAMLQKADIPLASSLAQHQADLQIKKQLLSGGINPDLDPAMLVTKIVPEHDRAKVNEEIKNAQDARSIAPKIVEAAKRAASMNPVTAAQGAREFEGLINTTITEKEGTARQAAFDSVHLTMTPTPGYKAFPGENEAKLRTALSYLSAKSSAPTAKGHGIDLQKFNSTRPLESAPEVQMRGGVPYVKVPGGWKKQ